MLIPKTFTCDITINDPSVDLMEVLETTSNKKKRIALVCLYDFYKDDLDTLMVGTYTVTVKSQLKGLPMFRIAYNLPKLQAA